MYLIFGRLAHNVDRGVLDLSTIGLAGLGKSS